MQGPPNHRAEDFEQLRLRKCPFLLDTIKWKSATKLGDGYDGCVWKVEFGNEGTFVLKVEAQQRQAVESLRAVLSYSPPIRRCYGWLDFDGDLIKRIPYQIKPQPRKRDKPPHSISPGNVYHAIIYKYISEDDNELASVKALLRFFHLIGFSFTCSPRIENWKGGRLIDGLDIVYPGGVGWDLQYYGSPRITAALLRSDPRPKV
ncbi:hypothetical protein F5B22DRAFT_632728 [Xylaria bambusicola]|uniref:uncharacterized protein n=1 Tax=Xylaria bambusicola TaxID=326684 RepID=UPI00200748D4|nr:uncharacterized protein F5B22DRAFT_632728 [Xylaria bambusicola]KAI0526162.1 hypothetical protein F5B22DRAFT_632728 [Xylaria bambusicola]